MPPIQQRTAGLALTPRESTGSSQREPGDPAILCFAKLPDGGSGTQSVSGLYLRPD